MSAIIFYPAIYSFIGYYLKEKKKRFCKKMKCKLVLTQKVQANQSHHQQSQHRNSRATYRINTVSSGSYSSYQKLRFIIPRQYRNQHDLESSAHQRQPNVMPPIHRHLHQHVLADGPYHPIHTIDTHQRVFYSRLFCVPTEFPGATRTFSVWQSTNVTTTRMPPSR